MGCCLSHRRSPLPSESVKVESRTGGQNHSSQNEMSPISIVAESDSSTVASSTDDNLLLDQELGEQNSLTGLHAFQGISDSSLKRVLCKAKFHYFQDQEVICRQGSRADTSDPVFVIWRGRVEVQISGSKFERIVLGKGNLLGELSILFGSPRNATVVALGDMTCIGIPGTVFRQLAVPKTLIFLRQVPSLKGLTDAQLLEMEKKVHSAQFKDGETIIRHGDRGSSVFIIRHGWVRIVRPEPQNGMREVAMLRRGQIFGQRSLIGDGQRTATCIAVGEVSSIVFGKDEMLEIDNPALNEILDYDLVRSVFETQGLPTNRASLLETIDVEVKYEGDVLGRRDEPMYKLYILKKGKVLESEGSNIIKSVNGIIYFGGIDGSLACGTIVAAEKTILLVYSHVAALDAMPLTAGKKQHGHILFSDLKFLDLLGEGGSGHVYLVAHQKTNDLYALKCIDKSRIRHVKQMQHVKNELAIISTIDHPFCTKFYQAYQDLSTLYILQEWVSGGELFNQMRHIS